VARYIADFELILPDGGHFGGGGVVRERMPRHIGSVDRRRQQRQYECEQAAADGRHERMIARPGQKLGHIDTRLR
jgi:hypothetical protein